MGGSSGIAARKRVVREGSVCRKTAKRATKRSCMDEKCPATKAYDLRTKEYSASKAVRRMADVQTTEELAQKLEELGLPTTGSKTVLRERLRRAKEGNITITAIMATITVTVAKVRRQWTTHIKT